jgi:hypothetical protein
MDVVDGMIKNTTDPFVQKHPKILRKLIEGVAKDNWLNNGDPILTKEQMDMVYILAKNKSGDKSWEIVGPFNICMN